MSEGTTSRAIPAAPKARRRRPWRDNLEAFGVAILMAVLLKPMIIEAYQIPTPSMQPTLMGSSDAGVFDRILVDKLRYELFEPERWDIVVFRYPIRRNQNYVKRIVGMPEDLLRIAGGNLNRLAADLRSIEEVCRKPDRIQAECWKEIYPARRLLDAPVSSAVPAILGPYFEGARGTWREDADDLVVTASARGSALLSYTDNAHGGIANQIYDGYPIDIARAIREHSGAMAAPEGVQDVRFAATITPKSEPSLVRFELRLDPDGKPDRRYRLEIRNGMGRLTVLVGDSAEGAPQAESQPFACSVPAGAATALAFAHVDDRLVAWHEGREVATLEVGEHRFALPLEPRQLFLTLETMDGGELRFADLRVERDLHYVPEGLGDALEVLVPDEVVAAGEDRAMVNHVIRIPPGHYFMMGDNTLASADSRQWKVLALGMSPDHELVDPSGHPEARVLRGNKRPWDLDVSPDNDENPVIVRAADPNAPDRIAFTDDNGEVFAMRGKIAPGYNPRADDGMLFKHRDGDGNGSATWAPREEHVFFVPREHILGRPLLCFWPLGRIGFIR